MTNWAILIPLLPLLAASLIGLLHFAKILNGESGEKTTARVALSAMGLSCLLTLGGLIATLTGHLQPPDHHVRTHHHLRQSQQVVRQQFPRVA